MTDRQPWLTIYRPADRRTRVTLNRYPSRVIGLAITAFGWCFSLVWAKP